jgi:protein-disulfide isomerase
MKTPFFIHVAAVLIAAVLTGITAGVVFNRASSHEQIETISFLHLNSAQVIDTKRDGTFPKRLPVLVEFIDYQCGPCQHSQQRVKAYQEKYPGRFFLAVRQFPLTSIHPAAEDYASAAEAARLQGRFWPMHQALFSLHERASRPALRKMAVRMGMNANRFDADFDTAKQAITNDRNLAKRVGVEGTPTFIICFPDGEVAKLGELGQIEELID